MLAPCGTFMATKLTFLSYSCGGGAHFLAKENLISPIRDVQHLAEALSISNHFVHQFPAFIVMGGADHKLFNLGKRSNISMGRIHSAYVLLLTKNSSSQS